MAPEHEHAGQSLPPIVDHGIDWRAYVARTRGSYIDRYARFAQQDTNNYSGLEKELENMMNAAEQAVAQGTHSAVLELAEWLWSGGGQFLDVHGHIEEARQLLTRAVSAARLSGDRTQEERLIGQIGRVSMALGNWAAAAEYFEQALAIAKEVGDLAGEASHLGNLGQIELEQKQQANAEHRFQAALKIAREIRDRQMEGRLLGSLALITLRSHPWGKDSAIENLKAAVAIARETGDRRGEASHLGSIGAAYEFTMSLPPFVWASPYPGGDDQRYAEYQEQLKEANQKSYLEAYEYYSEAFAVARKAQDLQAQHRLSNDLHRVGGKASLPMHSSGGVNHNIWYRNTSSAAWKLTDGRVPGTRYLTKQTAGDKT